MYLTTWGPINFFDGDRPSDDRSAIAVYPVDAVILRVPSTLSMLLSGKLFRTGHPYAVEVVGDPYDVFAPGAVRHPLRPFLRWRFTREMKIQCRHAAVATYVTAAALQRRYPPGPDTRAFCFSDVQLDRFLVASPRPEVMKDHWTLITVGSLAQLYKAPDVQIDALHLCRARGLDVRLLIIGDGRHRTELAQRAAKLGIGPHVEFLGQLPAGSAIRDVLDRADLFLMPSRTEGLPRARLEAMARALPCIGSHVGGIPELLPADDRVSPGNPTALSQKIWDVVSNPARMALMSSRNLQKSREFTEDALRATRLAFFRSVRDRAPAPITGGSAADHGTCSSDQPGSPQP